MTPYERWSVLRAEMNDLYEVVTESQGRLTIGPSSTHGVYFKVKALDGKETQISNVTEEEARFIIGHLLKVFGLTA